MNLPFDPATFVAATAAIVLVAVVVRLLLPAGRRDAFPYLRVEEALSPAERSFFGVLRQAVGSEYEILAKVRLADVIRVGDGLSRSRRYSAFGRISAKHVDFLLCHRGTFQIAGVIELDDSSHLRDDRRQRDAFVDAALAAASVPIIHFAARRAYSATEVRDQVAKVFAPPLAGATSPASAVGAAPTLDAPTLFAPDQPRIGGVRSPRSPRPTRGLLKLAGALVILMIVAAGLRKPEVAVPPATAISNTPPPSQQAISSDRGRDRAPAAPAATPGMPDIFASMRNAPRVIGYRNESVPGKPLEECMGPDNELNDAVRRCREGYTQRVPVYR
jgi:hypothetical protein